MKLILANRYYPFTQKPVDYQPYRPVYLFRGPPPDAGFSYGLFEDETLCKKYYADMGLDSFSPFSGTPSKLLEEVPFKDLDNLFNEDFKKSLCKNVCNNCSSTFFDNFHTALKGREDFYCHRCGAKLDMHVEAKVSVTDVSKDPNVLKFVENGLNLLLKSSQMKELSERISNRYSLPIDKVKKEILLALKDAIR